MRIRILADTHGNMEKIKYGEICDCIVVLGDFGFTGEKLKELENFLIEGDQKLFFVDGNHEYYPKLNNTNEDYVLGGKVGVYGRNIYWLKRGEVYEIKGKKILTFGGAFSIDRVHRVEGVSWFLEEEYTSDDYKNLEENMVKYNYNFDYIFTHDCPLSIGELIHGNYIQPSRTSRLLDRVEDMCNFKRWFFGHHHIDIEIGKYTGLWESDYILKI